LFEKVPEWLTDKVRGLRSSPYQDRESIYFNAAGWTIAWYLQRDIRGEKDPFFEFPTQAGVVETNHPLWQAHVNRGILVAETLFLMRNSPGFEEQRKRMAERSIRPAFFEMLSAKQFLKNKFEISARPERGKRGDDFDFIATRAGQAVNVEVTALTAEEFSEKTIVNRLSDKRNQVPKTSPAVLFCVVPEHWTSAGNVNWDEVLGRIAGKFFRGTKRINVVIFWIEQHLPIAGGGSALISVRKPYLNTNTYHQFHAPFLFGGSRRSGDVRRAFITGERLGDLESESYDSEFFRWVDSLVYSDDGPTLEHRSCPLQKRTRIIARRNRTAADAVIKRTLATLPKNMFDAARILHRQ
jgi:hypothetical protein